MKRLLVLALMPFGASCIIAESPATIPVQNAVPPVILQTSASPTTSAILVTFPPSGFLVPVKLFDPEQTFVWRVFVDFNPQDSNAELAAQGTDRTKSTGASSPGVEDVTPEDARQGIRRIKFLAPQVDDQTCHTIEFIITTDKGTGNPQNLHAVDPTTSDKITWFYSPTGDRAECPVQDAGFGGNDGTN
jgi:hypothetical protein